MLPDMKQYMEHIFHDHSLRKQFYIRRNASSQNGFQLQCISNQHMASLYQQHLYTDDSPRKSHLGLFQCIILRIFYTYKSIAYIFYVVYH